MNNLFCNTTIIALGVGTALVIMAITASLPVTQPEQSGLKPYDFKSRFNLREFCEREGINYGEVTR